MDCICGGDNADCTLCEGSGRMKIDCCPKSLITEETMEFLHHSDLARDHGILPTAFGGLQQSDGFMRACRWFWAMERRMEMERLQAK